jgi:hypothetical protein
MLELTIFNKKSREDRNFASWEQTLESNSYHAELLIHKSKLKLKEGSAKPILEEDIKSLNLFIKGNPSLREFFDDFSDSVLRIELRNHFHHLLLYDASEKKLILDSDINPKLYSVYLFAFYYALSRESNSPNNIFKSFCDFFLALDREYFLELLNFYQNNSELDAGSYFYEFLKKLDKNREPNRSKSQKFLDTQLLRNRSLVGKLPWDIKKLEQVRDKFLNSESGVFCKEAVDEYFTALKVSYDPQYANLYFRNLGKVSKILGFKLLAQRGSRVAHEQAPLLVNSREVFPNLEKGSTLDLRFESLVSEIKRIRSEVFFDDQDFADLIIKTDTYLSEIRDLFFSRSFYRAKFKKYFSILKNTMKEIFFRIENVLLADSVKFSNYFEKYQNRKKEILKSLVLMNEEIDKLFQTQNHIVIFVQRPSARSAHMIPRILLGDNLYVETDSESEVQRFDAIPFIFVVPELDLIANYLDAFFENASISIYSDRDTGKPEVKWSNAEDLALNLAPAFLKAIKSKFSSGSRFLYQLETTLFGPLVDLFLCILEAEMSNIATLEQSPELVLDLESSLKSNELKILEAADFVFKYYLYEDILEDLILREGLDRTEAVFQCIATNSDICNDIADCVLLLDSDLESFRFIKNRYEELLFQKKSNTSLSFEFIAQSISAELNSAASALADSPEYKRLFLKKYILYPESNFRKEILGKNKNLKRVVLSSNKKLKGIDYYYDFSVAPSRIDFGKNVVASVTSLMGRILGADDEDSLSQAKIFIDAVSESQNFIFNSASEAASVKVIENTCRALQYAKTISFQGLFQEFDIDGNLARACINSRNTKEAGVHLVEYGTMASTGYCITKEPLFIILSLSSSSEDLLMKLGISDSLHRIEISNFYKELLSKRSKFLSQEDWYVYIYEEINSSELIKKYLLDSNYPSLVNPQSLLRLFDYLSEKSDPDSIALRSYSQLLSHLVEQARLINESGIIQRIQIMNDAINRSKLNLNSTKKYSELKIAFNASYKGNVSDERENANQYLIAILLQQKQFIKNISNESIAKLISHQFQNYSLPLEIRIYDPYVDSELFMGGELKLIAENTEFKLLEIFKSLSPSFNAEQLRAMILSYGSDYKNWRFLNRELLKFDNERRSETDSQLASLISETKYLELYLNGFYKDAKTGYQSIDVIHLNSDHDEIRRVLEDLVSLKHIMQAKNPNSLLVLIDNPQQAKNPFMDYLSVEEWLALGGTYASHMLSSMKIELMRAEIKESVLWSKEFVKKIFRDFNSNPSQDEHQIDETFLESFFIKAKKHSEIKKEIYLQKFNEAFEIKANTSLLLKYQKIISFYNRLSDYQSYEDLNFDDWLILAGRFFLNGAVPSHIEYIFQLFESSLKKTLTRNTLDLFVRANIGLALPKRDRKILISGSTKESDLIVQEASDSIEIRAKISKNSRLYRDRLYNFHKYLSSKPDMLEFPYLQEVFINKFNEFEIKNLNLKFKNIDDWNFHFSEIQILLYQSFMRFLNNLSLSELEKEEFTSSVKNFLEAQEYNSSDLEIFFGDHKSSRGLFYKIASKIAGIKKQALFLELIFLAELVYYANLLHLILESEDENQIINKLASFFDQFVNVHEEDFPPYLFHRLSCGEFYGFYQDYYMDNSLREKIFKLSKDLSVKIYKLLRFSILNIGILQNASKEYQNALIGDLENGIQPLLSIHETLCEEEKFWDLLKAIRNLVRNYHDKHPLPIIIKDSSATVEKLFRYSLGPDVELCWVACLANIGKHSWDLNSVLRSPELRKPIYNEKLSKTYSILSIITPYLTKENRIRQIYTSFQPELIERQGLEYLAPYPDQSFSLNEYGFVHAFVLFNELDSLALPSISMSAHTHPQYTNLQVSKFGSPETWSFLSMRQMYSKTELPKILKLAALEPLAQIEFYQAEYPSISAIELALKDEIKKRNLSHIDYWLLKASRDSGGRGISEKLNINDPEDFQKILDFIFERTRTDDLVMQEFVPNNAKAFIKTSFLEEIEASIIESGIAYTKFLPQETIYFAMRSFQSITGIKGYLFSTNIGSETVNAGQGAKLFYGEPIKIMPLYIAGKIQNLLDEKGELILKQAIPRHAELYAKENNLRIIHYKGNLRNTFMLNGLFDYIPYIYVKRDAKTFKVVCEDNSKGGLDYYYSYYGKRIILISESDHESSILALENLLKDSSNGFLVDRPEEEIDIDLAVIELNSGLGQANLLQKAIETSYPENKDIFLDWTRDIAYVAMSAS